MYRLLCAGWLLFALIPFGGRGPAALRAAEAPELPATTVNSPPLTKEGLRGKVVVFYFYEETCPRCRGAWPGRLQVAEGYRDKPVVFVAVNSGTSAAETAAYLKSVNCHWPGIVDADRRFEKAMGIDPEISLQNIYQASIITPSGELVDASFQDLKADIDRYLGEATWRVEAAEITAPLRPAWWAFETGQFNQAGVMLKGAGRLARTDADKAALETLKRAISGEFEKLVASAKEAEEAGETWTAYRRYQAAERVFPSVPEVAEVKQKLSKLAADPAVVKEVRAARVWNNAVAASRAAGPAGQKRVQNIARQVVRDYPGTEAAASAQAALDKAP